MGIFKKNKTENLLLEDKELLSECKSSLAAVNSKIELDNTNLYKKTLLIIDGIEYSSPSKDADIYEMDKKILAAIGDLKIAVRRRVEKSNVEYCENILKNIKQLLNARNEKVKSFKQQR